MCLKKLLLDSILVGFSVRERTWARADEARIELRLEARVAHKVWEGKHDVTYSEELSTASCTTAPYTVCFRRRRFVTAA